MTGRRPGDALFGPDARTNALAPQAAAELLRSLTTKPTKQPGRQKYNARPVAIDGIRFASQAEARRYQALQTLERAGEIRGLKPHPSFVMTVNGKRIGRFTADSEYIMVATGERVVEDVKSEPTRQAEAYRLRKRLVEACCGVTITEYEERPRGRQRGSDRRGSSAVRADVSPSNHELPDAQRLGRS